MDRFQVLITDVVIVYLLGTSAKSSWHYMTRRVRRLGVFMPPNARVIISIMSRARAASGLRNGKHLRVNQFEKSD